MAALMMNEDTCRLIRESTGLFGTDVEQEVIATAAHESAWEQASLTERIGLDNAERSALHASWVLGTGLGMRWHE
jgi:hypothetical protein